MKNHVQKGENITVSAPVDIVLGAPITSNSLFGIAAKDTKNGTDNDLVAVGAFTLTKVAAFAVALSDKLYFDAASGLVNKRRLASLVGFAVAAAADRPAPSMCA